VRPILHLSIPVRDLAEARKFYVGMLGCQAARTGDDSCDVWFYGMQITLQDRPDEVRAVAGPGSRHFGVTLERREFEAAIDRLDAGGVEWVNAVATDHEGAATEQTKAKIADPSGNVIELKTYRDVESALEIPVPRTAT
jgi:extradiol dioxygenase family protein